MKRRRRFRIAPKLSNWVGFGTMMAGLAMGTVSTQAQLFVGPPDVDDVPVAGGEAPVRPAKGLGGPLPPPATEQVSITWDDRFGDAPRNVSIVQDDKTNLAYIEGDILIGSLGDVRRAQANDLARRARETLASGELGNLDLSDAQIKLLQEMAKLGQQKTPLKVKNPARAKAIELLGDIDRFGVLQGAINGPDAAAPRDLGAPDDSAAFPVKALEDLRQQGPDAEDQPVFAPADDILPLDDDAPEDDNPPVDSSIVQFKSFGLDVHSQYRWTNGIVPYFIESNYPEPARITNAMALWTAKTSSIRFVEYRAYAQEFGSAPRHWIQFRFQAGKAGGSAVGMVSPDGFGQLIVLPEPRTFPEPNIAHELGHALGLFHEQSRPDRDDYLEFNEANVIPGYEDQFKPPKQLYQIYGKFDFGSIMLYNSWAFSQNGLETVRSRWPQISGPSGHWGLNSSNIKGPSKSDIAVIDALYFKSAAPAAAPRDYAPQAAPDSSMFPGAPGTSRHLPGVNQPLGPSDDEEPAAAPVGPQESRALSNPFSGRTSRTRSLKSDQPARGRHRPGASTPVKTPNESGEPSPKGDGESEASDSTPENPGR